MMKELYRPEEAEAYLRRAKRTRAAMGWIGGIALAACVVLCFFVNTGNALWLQWTVIGLFVAGLWTVVLLRELRLIPARAEADHMRGVLAGEPEEREGVLTLESTVFQIPNSIAVRGAVLRQGEESLRLSVDAARVKDLPSTPCNVRVRVVRKYVVAWEEIGEAGEA